MTGTEPIIRIRIEARSMCPKCMKSVESTRELSEEQIRLDQLDQVVLALSNELRALLNRTIVARGWTNKVCGACRDVDGGGAVGIVRETKGKDPKDHEADHDCA